MRTLTAMVLTLVLAIRAVSADPGIPAGEQPAPKPAEASRFEVAIDPKVYPGTYTGRVYVVLSDRAQPEPRAQMGNWFRAPQIIAMDVEMKPGESVVVGPGALTYPSTSFELVPERTYQVQAVARVSLDSAVPGEGEGDLCSEVREVSFTRRGSGNSGALLTLTLDRRVEGRQPRETEWVKYFEMESPLLSAFHGRSVKARAGVVLPEGWRDDPSEHYPTVYFISGFGGDAAFAGAVAGMMSRVREARGIMFVVPDPSCFWGHSVFADSATNGPRGRSLIEEMIPAVESRFHGAGSVERRFVTGISSGGWSSLWLQVEYPDAFGGCWSHCPDPVDFRDFQWIDLYAPGANMYRDGSGERRPLARSPGGGTSLWYDEFVRRETVLGPGGQIQSFEAVFSPRGPDGKPLALFDRATGRVDPAVARSWEKYDLRLKLEREWKEKGPRLAGKLHVYAGERDTYFLEGAAMKLGESLKGLGSDAEVVVVPQMVHTIYQKGVRSMCEEIRRRCGMPEAREPEPAGAGAR